MSTSPTQRYTLDTLSARANEIRAQGKINGSANGSANGTAIGTPIVVVDQPTPVQKHQSWGGLTWLIILALVIGLILFLFRPDIVLSTSATGEKYLNWGLLILWAIGIALAIVLLLWLTRGAHNLLSSDY